MTIIQVGDEHITLRPCVQCGGTEALMTCTDLHADPLRNQMVYRLRCVDCGWHPPWGDSAASAVRRWQGRRKPR